MMIHRTDLNNKSIILLFIVIFWFFMITWILFIFTLLNLLAGLFIKATIFRLESLKRESWIKRKLLTKLSGWLKRFHNVFLWLGTVFSEAILLDSKSGRYTGYWLLYDISFMYDLLNGCFWILNWSWLFYFNLNAWFQIIFFSFFDIIVIKIPKGLILKGFLPSFWRILDRCWLIRAYLRSLLMNTVGNSRQYIIQRWYYFSFNFKKFFMC
jgi:hypothetical protein